MEHDWNSSQHRFMFCILHDYHTYVKLFIHASYLECKAWSMHGWTLKGGGHMNLLGMSQNGAMFLALFMHDAKGALKGVLLYCNWSCWLLSAWIRILRYSSWFVRESLFTLKWLEKLVAILCLFWLRWNYKLNFCRISRHQRLIRNVNPTPLLSIIIFSHSQLHSYYYTTTTTTKLPPICLDEEKEEKVLEREVQSVTERSCETTSRESLNRPSDV